MIKKMIVVAAMAILSLGAQAQYVFEEGDIAINVGLGVLSVDGLMPTIHASAELGLFPTGDVGIISLGGSFEYKYSELKDSNYNYNYNRIAFGPRATWHMHLPFLANTDYDLYAGIGTGLKIYSDYYEIDHNLDPKVAPYFETFVGGRMMLDDTFGVFAELGGGLISAAKAGIVIRL